MSNPQKDLRKQLRNLVQEELPEILSNELIKAQYDQLVKDVNAKIDAIDSRVKDILLYVMKSSGPVNFKKKD